MLCTAVLMAVWLTDSMNMIPWLLPALAATLTMLMTYRFDDTPVIRVLPWCAALTAAAFLLTGNGIADNPLKEKADEIRQAILDRLFFTEARDVFSLYSVGFSPQGADQLGGKHQPGAVVVPHGGIPEDCLSARNRLQQIYGTRMAKHDRRKAISVAVQADGGYAREAF